MNNNTNNTKKRFVWLFLFWLMSVSSIPFLSAQTTLEVWEIQGTSNNSPFFNSTIRTQNNIVTAVNDDYFVIQTPDSRSDGNIQSSDGIIVVENNFNFDVGDMVNVEGRVAESYFGTTLIDVENVASELVSSGNPLPTLTVIDESYPIDQDSNISAWEWVESMLVSLENFKITEASDEDGRCYVSPATNRPFREAGSTNSSSAPQWDGNPETLVFFTDGFDLAPNRALGAEMSLNGLAIISGEPGDYAVLPITYSVSGDYKQNAVRAKENREATIGNLNMLLFFPDESNYNFRVQKFATYILESMQAPDIIAFQEVGELQGLEDVASEIADRDETQVYTAYLRKGSGSIHTGFLVKNTVSNIEIQQLGEAESLSIGGRKHDRPPLLLEAQLNTSPPTPLAILNVHIRSLNGIEGSDQTFVRTKRHEQGISIANMVKALQLQYQNVFVVGDFNAFQFSDGYVDVVNQIAGTPSLGAQYEVEEVLDVPLVNRSLSVAPEEQYSYVFRGNAQILDHCLSTSNLSQMEFDELQYVRGNADNPTILENSDPLLRVSDHDGFVLFLDLEDNLSVTPTFNPPTVVDGISHPNPFVWGDQISFNLSQKENLEYQLISLHGIVVQNGDLDGIQNAIFELPIPSFVVDGIYILKIQGSTTDYLTKIYIDN